MLHKLGIRKSLLINSLSFKVIYLVIFIHFCFFSRFTHGSCHKRGTACLISIIHTRTIIKEALIFNRCVQLSPLHEYDRSARLRIASFPSLRMRNARWTQGTGLIALYSTVQYSLILQSVILLPQCCTDHYVSRPRIRTKGQGDTWVLIRATLSPGSGERGPSLFLKGKAAGTRVEPWGCLSCSPCSSGTFLNPTTSNFWIWFGLQVAVLSRISHYDHGTNTTPRLTEYSDLYEIIHSSLDRAEVVCRARSIKSRCVNHTLLPGWLN